MADPVIRTYLEMRTQPGPERLPPPPGATIDYLEQCDPSFYRQLYRDVGQEWSWFDRLWWSDAKLAAHLDQPEVAIRVLRLDGEPAGYYELVHQPDGSVEIGYFGLMRHAIGKGLGRWLLSEAIREAWSSAPPRIWLHTCTLDHPQALPNYLKAGFAVVRSEQVAPPAPPPGKGK